jgi:TolA-binding protein
MVASADIDTIGKQLSGKRRAVLTSPWSIDYTPSDKSAEISLYTQFLLNGLETGMADGAIPNRNLNGEITAIELHAYISDRLSEEAPALHPQFYAVGQGNEIKIANAPYLDFRREALGLAIPGEISPVGHSILDAMGQRLGMPEAVDKDIRKDALRPYQLKTQKQKQLEQLQTQMTEREGELSDNTRTELRRLQEMYDLKTEPPTRSSEAAAAIADTRLDPPRALVPFEQHPPIPSEPLDEEPGSNPFSRLWQDNIIQERGLTPDLLRMALASVAVLGLAGLVLWVALQPFSNNRPATFAGYFQEGYQEASRNDRKDAITAYTEAIKLDPENAAAYYNRGIEYAKQNDRNQAIQDYTDAIKLSPNFADAYFNRANSYFVRGEKDAAIQDYRKAAQLYQKLNRIDDRKRALDAIQIAQRQP